MQDDARQTKRHILFICFANSCRSQMAEGFALQSAGGAFTVSSAGIKPLGYVDPNAICVMREAGIDISAQQSKLVTADLFQMADVIVFMAGFDLKNIFNLQNKKSYTWNIDDPFGRHIDFYRTTREEIKLRVKELVELLGV